MGLSMKMKYFVFLLGASTLTFAIQVPSSWQQEGKHDISLYRGLRPSRHDNQIQAKIPNGIDQNNGRRYSTPRSSLTQFPSSPVTKKNWGTVVQNMPKHANKKLVKQKYVSNGHPYQGSELKKSISKKPFRPSTPERASLEFYMTPKSNQQKLFNNPKPPRSQHAFHLTPQNILSTPQPQLNFDPFGASQPKIANKQITRPNSFASFTNTIPPSVNNDQFFNIFANRKPQTQQLHEQFENLPSFTTSVPTVQNFDQHFNIPPSYESVELLQNTNINNNLYNKNDNSNSHSSVDYNIDPFVRPDKYLQAENLHSFNTPQNVDRNINYAKSFAPVEPFHNPKFENHLYKNYRDDKTHEPINFDPFLDEGHIPEVNREETEKSPISNHENPAEVPTKPIYPGPGQWAKSGIRHRPFVNKQKYDNLEEDEETPEGYNTFVEGEKLFNKLNGKFEQSLSSFPEKHNLGQFLDKKTSNSDRDISENEEDTSKVKEGNGPEREDGEEEEEEEEFIPTRLYAQVRRSEDVEHLPVDNAVEPRLRELIKESKIQTVYTEEGYEDSAYDHAGHEKKADNEEGFTELDKAKEKIEVKKVPDPKYNLHLKPKYELVEYGDENELPTDEEIEQYKRDELGLEDSDSDGSQSGSYPNSIGEEKEIETKSNIPEKRKIKSNNNFITTKEVKTMTMKENGNGDTETEISSRVKMILQPNNHTKTHEFVKIHPKIYSGTNGKNSNRSVGDDETIAKVEELPSEPKQISSNGIYIEEILSTTTDIPITTVPTSEFTVIFTEEIPITTLATTAIPSIRETTSHTEGITETLESIEKAFWGQGSRFRKKRFINDFPKIQVDTDFISKINHDLKEPKEDSSDTKYPYYIKIENDGINENSPLRYSENLKNIPLKKESNMAFYEQADSMTVCPESETMLDPIPERIQNAKKKGNEPEGDYDEDEEGKVAESVDNVTNNSEGLAEQPKPPRLTGLDDKINCLKAKYFGRNPLDSPFFAEETVGTVMPFYELSQNRNKAARKFENGKTNFTNNDATADNEIFGASDYEHENGQLNGTATTDTPTTINFEELSKAVLKDVTNNMKTMGQTDHTKTPSVQTVTTINLLTTPQYTIDLKPKHIYDQIQLLNHMPVKLNVSNNKTVENTVQISSNVEHNSKEIRQDETVRRPRKNDGEEEETLAYDSSIASPSILENLTDDSSDGILPDAEALRRRRKFRRKRPLYQTHGIKRILSTTNQPIFGNHITASTVLPKYKVVSEVFYKDDIKPNEQLNVFTDILNNIRNSSQEAADALQNSSESGTGTLRSKHRIDQSKLPEKYNRDSYLKAYSDQDINNSYYVSKVSSTTTTTVKPNVYRDATMYNTKSFYNGLDNTHIRKDEDALDKYRLYIALLDAKTKQNSGLATTTHTPPDPSEYDDIDSDAKTLKVMGLMPPGMHRYKTIHHPKRDNQNLFKNPGYMEKKGINNFLVMGMKPPPKQRVFSYSDFGDKNYNIMRRLPLRRGKRSTNQSSYAQLARNRGQEEHLDETMTDDDDDDDDYVPHRPTNFYYDEKTGKIVYNNIKKPEKESDEDIEYVEITEEPPQTTPKSKPKQDPIFATATPPPKGQSYVDFVKKLKSAPNYKLIPDPTTTERGAEMSTDKVTTIKSEPTEPPEFLSILGKVRQNSEYKFIEDKKDKEKVMISSTESPEETAEVDEDEEISPTNVKNSPGGVQHELSQGFQIFDISDYIPKLRNYLPRTSIDTSKYKTIQRPTVAPVLEKESKKVPQTANSPKSKIASDSEETENSQTSNTNNRPVFIHTMKVNDVTESTSDELVTEMKEERTSSPSTTIGTTIHKKQSPIIQNRKRRPTTSRTVVNTRREIPTTSSSPLATLEPQTEHHPKSRRNYRRRPTRIRVTATTENIGDDDIDDTTKVLRRRSNSYDRKANEVTKVSTTVRSVTNRPKVEPKEYVDILKKYSQNKRRGSNFGKNLETNTHQSLNESVSEDTRNGRDVEIIGEYNKDEKHGGNYKREDVGYTVEDKKTERANDPKDGVMIINLLPEYGSEDRTDAQVETTTANLLIPKINIRSNKPKRILIKQKSPFSEVKKPVQRLTDVVTKPETFYTDPSLPRSINSLMGIEALSSEEIRSISEAETSGENFLSGKESSPVESNTLKKPAYIEDPSKRLYYYAPI